MALAAGAKLGSYEVGALLGAGGMGEVYRAKDPRLGRDVALKILPEAFARDADRMMRFEREAKVLASLNHPNVASIYGLEESNGARALVMELVEGPTLAERIRQGPLPLDEALVIARQIAEGLEYAHERGIVHRDLKPSNVKLTPDGHAKILDFGLAKALEGETSEQDLQNSPTLSAAATRAGMLLGTAAYMSPEQARGKRVDRRADIWAFGCVLYEMLTGGDPFGGETTSDILASVIRAEPDWSAVPGSVPPRIRQLLYRCLRKDPKQRLQAIGEARIAIEEAIAGTPEEAVLASTEAQKLPPSRRALPWTLALISVAVAVGVSALYWRASRPEPHQVMKLSLTLPETLAGVSWANPGSPIALSPDGTRLVFVASPAGKPSQLYLRPLDQQMATPIPNTEDAIQPFFSPDGQWVGFFSGGKIRKVSLRGGPSTALGDAPVPHGASWAGDDTIIYGPNFGSGLMRISSAGGAPRALTTPNAKEQEVSHRWPQVLPGGKAVLFTIQTTSQISYDEARIAVLSLETGKWLTLVEGGSYARYVPSGHIIYAHSGTLMAVPFDLRHLVVTGAGAPVLVEEGILKRAGTSGGAEYDVTPSGLLAYVPGTARPPERSLVWVDRHGVSKELPAPLKNYSAPQISPDGKRLAMQISTGTGLADIWIYEFARNTLTRLTFGTGANSRPLWTPDGRKIIYLSVRTSPSFRWKLADGSGTEEILLSNDIQPNVLPLSVSPDGKTLLFDRPESTGAIATYALSLESAKIQPFLKSAFAQTQARFSPDGHWVAYTSNESGREEIYVQPYPGPGGKWLISTDGGSYAAWAPNGREIFFRNEDKMMSVPIETQPVFKAGSPRELFRGGGYVGVGNYDVPPDGQHFLMVKEKEAPASSRELNVIVNWSEELRRRVPSEKK